MNGIVVIDKAPGMTSHDVVRHLRRILGERSIGHLGTLDPLATGVLPMLIGKFTRLAQFFVQAEKTYEGTIRLGQATTTYDAEGEFVGEAVPVDVAGEQIESAMARFRGAIEQMPPAFSAKKIQGVPAYKLARREKPVELRPVQVNVAEFTLLDLERDVVRFRTTVSAGTYVRSLAHDLGQALGVGAHLASLRRTRSGEFTLEEAVTLATLERLRDSDALAQAFLDPRRILPAMPSVTAADEQLARLRNGNAINLPDFSAARMVKVFAPGEGLIAVASRIAGTLFQPKVVLAEQPSPSYNVR